MIFILGVTLICDKSAGVLASKRDLTPSVFHRTESDFDLIAKIKYLEKEWCRDITISYSWVRGHADRMDRPLTRNQRLNIETDAIVDQIRIEACGPRGARPQCNHWELEWVSLSIEGVKCMGHMKQKLRSQLHDVDMRYYLRLKDEWTPFTLESVAWDTYGTPFRRISNKRRVAVSKAGNNMWHTGDKHQQYYHEIIPCCMCHDPTE
jgi:hypothetical protein